LGAVTAWAMACSDQTNRTFTPPPDEIPDASAPDSGGVTGDPTKGILLVGTVIGEAGPFEGQVLVGVDGVIACAEPGTACEGDPRAAGAARASVGIIAPGLIDTHNHILFDIFDGDDWLPTRLYQNHDQWPDEERYKVMVDVKQCLEDASQGKPAWCPPKYDGAGSLRCEMLKWGELKALVAGTTSVVGLAGQTNPCYASLARSIDTPYNGLGSDKIQTSALFPPSQSTADGVCNNYASDKTDSFVIHVGEGIDARSLAEFTRLGTVTTTPGCLYAPETVITHGTALTATEFATMKSKDMKLVWSPASNIALYGQTTNIPAALDAGLLVSLAPDWSMGGSPNMLVELGFAKKYSDANWGGRLSAKDLVDMSTVHPALTLGVSDRLGKIKVGYLGDLFAIRGDATKPYDAIVAARPKDVSMTMVGGKVLYGDADLRALSLYAGACEDFDACGSAKFLCAADPTSAENKLGQKYEELKNILEAAMTDIDTVRPAGIGGNFAPVTPVVKCE
jgi:cytosine/adenosine deaminase-related metal-dependent hydrolase